MHIHQDSNPAKQFTEFLPKAAICFIRLLGLLYLCSLAHPIAEGGLFVYLTVLLRHPVLKRL